MKKSQIYIYFGQTHDKFSQSHIQILCWLSGLISLRCPIHCKYISLIIKKANLMLFA